MSLYLSLEWSSSSFLFSPAWLPVTTYSVHYQTCGLLLFFSFLEWLFTLEVSYSERLASSNIYSAKDCYLVRLLLVQRLTALEAELCRVDSTDPILVSTILDAYTQNPHLKQQSAYHRQVYMIISLTLSIVPEFAEYLLSCQSFFSRILCHVLKYLICYLSYDHVTYLSCFR